MRFLRRDPRVRRPARSRVFPREDPVVQREERQEAEPVLPDGRQHLRLDRGARIGFVQLVQVYPVRLQAAQRCLDREADVAARSPGAPVRSVRALHVHAELAREDDAIALAVKRIAHERLTEATHLAVDVGRVEEGDAGLDGRVDHGIRALLRLGDGFCPAEVVAPEADRGDAKARWSEVSVLD